MSGITSAMRTVLRSAKWDSIWVGSGRATTSIRALVRRGLLVQRDDRCEITDAGRELLSAWDAERRAWREALRGMTVSVRADRLLTVLQLAAAAQRYGLVCPDEQARAIVELQGEFSATCGEEP